MPKNVNTKTHTTSPWADGKRRTNPPPVPTSAFNPPFPRIAGYILNDVLGYKAQSFVDHFKRYNFLILTHFFRMDAAMGEPMSTTIARIKAASPHTGDNAQKIFVYTKADEWSRDAGQLAVYPPAIKANAENWFVRNSWPSGSYVPSGFGDEYQLNNTTGCNADASGRRWQQWAAAYDYGQNVAGDAEHPANNQWDGEFFDNVFSSQGVDADYLRTGTAQSADSDPIRLALRNEWVNRTNYSRALWGAGKFILGNTARWPGETRRLNGGGPPAYNAADIAPYPQLLNGGMFESAIGQSYSPENWGGIDQLMAHYLYQMDASGDPKLVVFCHDNIASQQEAGYGLCCTLMDNGYYFGNTIGYASSDRTWYREYDNGGQLGYLGYPVAPRQSAAWQNGVWRREFQNGFVYMNPKGASTQSVAAPFNATRASDGTSVNAGQSISMPARSGLILVRR